jgi:hypothetical protein
MATLTTTTGIVLLGLVLGGGLGWAQWMILKRLLRRPGEWAATSVVGAAVSAPLGTGLALDSLVRAGLPPAAVWPVGLSILLAQLVLGTVWVGVVAVWGAGRRQG